MHKTITFWKVLELILALVYVQPAYSAIINPGMQN